MSELNSSVLKLSRNICSGKCGVEKTKDVIKDLDSKYGDWDMPVELPDGSNMSNEQYLKALADTINSGVFSKEALLKMAALSEQIYSNKGKFRYTKQLVIGGVVVFVIVIGIVIIVSMGGAK